MAVRIDWARSKAEMPVVMPSRASKLWVNGVADGSRLTPGNRLRPTRSHIGPAMARQSRPQALPDHEVDGLRA